MSKTKVDDMLLEMIQPKINEIETKFSSGEGLNQEDINTLLLKSQYNHINHLDSKLNEVTSSVIALEGKFNLLEAKFEALEDRVQSGLKEFDAKLGNMEAKFDAKFDSLKIEFEGKFAEQKADMKALKQELRTEIKDTINSNMKWSIGLIAFIVVGLKLIDMLLA